MAVSEVVRRSPEATPARWRHLLRIDSRLASIWVAGLLIRLLLLPFTAHLDLYHIYSRAAEAAYYGDWGGWGSQLVIQTFHNVWLLVIRPLLPGAEQIWSATAATMGAGAQPDELTNRFFAYPYLPRALFLLKLPYLVADLATGFVLTRLVPMHRRRWVLALWLLNPLVIYTSAIFARHDSISIFLVCVAVLLARRGRRYLGLGLLGLGAAARFFPVFVAPFFLLAYSRSRRELLSLFAGLSGIWMAVELAAWMLSGTSATLTLLTQYQHVAYLIQLGIHLFWYDHLFILPMVFLLLLLWYFEQGPRGTEDFVTGAAAGLLVLFALAFFHPPYVIWLAPFLALTIDRDGRLIAYHVIQIALVALYVFQWGPQMSIDLFLPLAPEVLRDLPDPRRVIGSQIQLDLFFGVIRSLFAGVSLWMAYRLLRDRWRSRKRAERSVTLQEVLDGVA